MEKKYIDQPPEGAAGWRRVWEEWRDYPRGTSAKSRVLEPLRSFLKRLLQDDRQRDFNLAMLDLAEDREREIAALREDFVRTTTQLAADVRKLEELLRVAVGRGDALVVALDQKLESTAARVRDMTLPLLPLSTDERSRLRGDLLYRRIEDGMRGSEREVREQLMPYLEYAKRSSPVIDVGCGRGEFLELCRDASVSAKGFDTNERSVAAAKAAGLEVELGGLPACLRDAADASVGMIFASHVVEHLPAETLFDFFSETARVLRPSGFLAIETPNARSIVTSASDFWRDPTHLAPKDEASLVLLAREFDFEIEEIRTVHPHEEGRRLPLPQSRELRDTIARLNDLLFGDQDLRIVFRKPK